MLFLTENGFLNLVYEPRLKNVLTLRTNYIKALQQFEELTPAKIVINPSDHTFPFVLYVRRDIVAKVLACPEVLAFNEPTIMPAAKPAVAFVLEGHDRDYANDITFYALPDELPGLQKSLADLENIAIYPLYKLPFDMNLEGGLA